MRFPLDLPPGTLRDDSEFSTPGRWADSDKVRYHFGRFQVIGGWTKAHDTAATGVSRNVLAWRDLLTRENIAIGTNSHLYAIRDGVMHDITPGDLTLGLPDNGSRPGYGSYTYGNGGYGGGPLNEVWPRTWSLANWGQALLASPRGKGLYIWENDPSAPAELVATAPANIFAMLNTPQRQVLALGCNRVSDGAFSSMVIRGSDFGDYTQWTPGTSNNAFEYVLEGGGKIIAGANYGPDVIVWTDTSLFYGQMTGEPGNPYRFDRIATNCGLAGPNAAIVVNQVAYWLTGDLQFYMWQAGAPPQPLPCPLREEFRDNMDALRPDKVVATGIAEYQEVWWFYPDVRDGQENSRYVAIDLSDGSWSKGTLPRTAAIDSGPLTYPLMMGSDSFPYFHEAGQDADGADLDWFIESSDLYFSEAENSVMVRGVWPDFQEQSSDVVLALNARPYPQAMPVLKGPYLLESGRDKRDLRATGKLFSVRFSGTRSGVRAGKQSFDVVRTGTR